jgi:galactokinase
VVVVPNFSKFVASFHPIVSIMSIHISAPGRICLFGEHQDYLGLPVIAAAISKRVHLKGAPRKDQKVVLHLPDVGKKEHFVLNYNQPLAYTQPRDYFKSVLNVLMERGLTFSQGFEVTVQGNIPINSGTSSSSALVVAYVGFAAAMSDQQVVYNQKTIGEIAYQAEVLCFGEPGGMMDQYSTAVGNVIYLASQPEIFIETLHPKLGKFVLGDSQEPKDTLTILGRLRGGVQQIVQKIQSIEPSFNLQNAILTDIHLPKHFLNAAESLLLEGTLTNRDLLRAAKKVLETNDLNHQLLGKLLSKHHVMLRDAQKISTPKIDKMLEMAMNAGALGGKINGSGGGGCMFAYAPENTEQVAAAIESAGGKAYIIDMDAGVQFQ